MGSKGCCGRKKMLTPKVTAEHKKVVDKIKSTNLSSNFGAVKRGRKGVTAYSRQCFNCHTVVSNVSVCPICGFRL